VVGSAGIVGEAELIGPADQYAFLCGFLRGLSIREEYIAPCFDEKDKVWFFPKLARWSDKVMTISRGDVAVFNLFPLRHQIQSIARRAVEMREEHTIFARSYGEIRVLLLHMLPSEEVP